MSTLNPFALVAPLIALQFAVFGWRIAREIAVGDQDGRTWLLISDFLNFIALVVVVAVCVILPLRTSAFPTVARAVLAAAYVIVCFTPFMIAGHYRLFSREGRLIYKECGSGVPWLTGQEMFFAAVSVAGSLLAAYIVGSQ
jgi:hypothetical protein